MVVTPPASEAPSQRFRLSHCLDRVTVQLFNAPDVTLKLAAQHRLLDTLVGLLRADISPWEEDADATGASNTGSTGGTLAAPPAGGHTALQAAAVGRAPATLMVDLARSVTEGRVYSRVLGDLRMVLAHPPVALHLLRERSDLVHALLGVLGALQGANGVARKWGEHVEEESHAWVNAVSLEVSLVSLWALLVEAAAECAPPPEPPPTQRWDARAGALARSAVTALRAAAAWAIADTAVPFSLDVHPVSVHLPLHRAAALTMSSLLLDLPREACGIDAAAALLRGDTAALGVTGAAQQGGPLCLPVGSLAALMRHPARVAAWSAAVRARLWVRNGAEVARLEHVYGSPFWAETGFDADLGLMQLCLAAAPDEAQADALAAVVLADNGMEELITATEQPQAQQEPHHSSQGVEPGADEETDADASHGVDAACESRCLDALRLLALLARERGLLAPQSPRARLRRAVVHWLAVNDLTHSALCAQLPASAPYAPDLGAVLAEVASFVAPASAERAGQYSLRPAAWAEWEPHFAHYTRAERDIATARAAQLAQPPWRPAAALRPPSLRPSAPFASLARFLRGPTVLRACTAAMRHASNRPASATADDLALEAMQLIALAAADATAAAESDAAIASLAASLAAEGTENEAEAPARSLLQLLCGFAAAGGTDTNSEAAADAPPAAVTETAAALLSDLRARGLAPPAPLPASSAGTTGAAPLADAAAAAREERKRAMRDRQRAVLAAMAAQQRAFAAKTEAAQDAREADDSDVDEEHEVVDGVGSDSDTGSTSEDMSDADEEDDEEEHGGCALCRNDAAAEDVEAAPDTLCWVALAQRSNIPALAERPALRGWRWAQLEGSARAAATPVGAAAAALGAATAAAAAAGAAAAVSGNGAAAMDDGEPPTEPAPRRLERTASAAALAARRLSSYEVAAAAATAAAAAAAAPAAPAASPFTAVPGVHVAVCGHRVHAACIARYVAALRASFAAGRHFPGEYLLAVDDGQFLCPVCRRLANCVVPALPALPPASAATAAMSVDGVSVRDELMSLDAIAEAVREKFVSPPCPATDTCALQRRRSADHVSSRPSSLDAGSLSSSLPGSRMLRRRPSASAAALEDATVGAASERFADRCRSLVGSPPPQSIGHGATLWASLAYNVAHWETASRSPGSAAHAPADAAARARSPQWIAMQALCRLALRASGAPQPKSPHDAAAPEAQQPSVAAEMLLSWVAGAGTEAPTGVLSPALPHATAATAAPLALSSMNRAPVHGAELLRLLMAGLRTPPTAQVATAMEMLRAAAAADADAPTGMDASAPGQEHVQGVEASLGGAAATATSEAPPPSVSLLVAAGDAFGLFCELVAASAAAYNASTYNVDGYAALLTSWREWEPTRVHALARLAATVAVAQAAAATGAAAAGSAISVSPIDALLAVADVACGEDAAAASPLLDALSRRCAVALRRCAVLAALLTEEPPPPHDAAYAPGAAPLALPSLRSLLSTAAHGAVAGAPCVRRWLLLPEAPGVLPECSPPSGTGGGREALRAWLAATGPMPTLPPAARAPTLLPLPHLYQDLFLEWADRPCGVCRRVPHEPALCLACGRLVCCAGTCCAEPGGRRECFMHAAECGAGAAVFLLVKATKLLLLRGSRRCLYPSPYLDAHGEEDAYLHRGRPLYLNAARYRHVQRLWGAASFDYDTLALHTSRAGAEFY